ncbi:DUF4372 domain-containing protein [Cyclobacterium marinum]|uniref:DUF4372 domain-containing protein n=1 Tax=Cyclobacterium marinum TaxID=104 RepID=UPI0005A502DE|nr:DUF4372 domain-containing protein [Cyclobacterium marinum]
MKQDKNNFLSGHPIIAQLLSMIPKDIFNQVVEQENSDRYYKKLKSIDHFICMFYAVLTRNSSLREVCKNISLIAQKLIPFGIKQLPAKSTLSDANRKRDNKVFAVLYSRLFAHYKRNFRVIGWILAEKLIPVAWKFLIPQQLRFLRRYSRELVETL